ncbi:MAG TPA: hypothetical protein VFV72_15000 [Candidatus Limnocylindrales bacterium]|nr:hypothetical protein [Candidatus Limnocylindrales bacterium]
MELPISPEPPPLVPWTVSITPPAAPINGWVAGQQPSALARPADRPPSTASRVLRAIAWIVGIAAMLFFGRIYAVFLGGTELTAEQTGEVVGYLLGSLLIGFAVRWLFVRAGRGKGLLSPWVPVVATFILLLNLGRASGQAPSSAAVVPTGGPAPTARATPAGSPRDIEAFLVIAEPYDMERATAEEVTDFGEAMGAFSDQTQVRRITRDGIVEGFFVVVDSGDKFPVNSLGAFEFGLKTQEGIDTERATLGGHEVVVATVPDDEVAFVSWLEVPRILVVYGVDEASARNMATAVINAYK